jgi:hypothetical protein
MINQLLLKMICPLQPVLPEIHGKIAGDDHPSPIRHKPSSIHVPNQCINQGHPSPSLPPPLYHLGLRLPLVVRPVIYSIGAEDLGAVLHAPEAVEISPEQLIDEDLRRVVPPMFVLKRLHLVVHVARGERACGEPR